MKFSTHFSNRSKEENKNAPRRTIRNVAKITFLRKKIANRKLPKLFDYRESLTIKTDNPINSNEVLTLCNHASPETTVEQNIDLPDSSSGINFLNPLISVKNIYSHESHP